MIHTIEFINTYKVQGSLVTIDIPANEKLLNWQRTFKGKKPDIKSAQKTKDGIFVVYEL